MKLTGSILGTTVIGAACFLDGCKRANRESGLITTSDLALLDELGETILPATDRSPGAKDAGIGIFMKTIVTDCYAPAEQQRFIDGLGQIRQRAEREYGKGFMELSPIERYGLLLPLDKEAREAAGKGETHYFSMFKQLTLWGYFSSEPGATKALRYNPTPGKFVGCIPYNEGDKAWAR